MSYGYYGLSEAVYWDPIGSIRIGRNSATIRWMRMECPVKLITPEEKKRKQAEEDRRRALQREAKRMKTKEEKERDKGKLKLIKVNILK